MIAAILAGFMLYSLVMLAVGIAMPYPELLKQLHADRLADGAAWGTGVVAVMAFGKLGGLILAIATFGAACTGINGFYIAGSRLLLSMARSKMVPSWFGAIHPKYNTPYNAILFIMIIAMLTPFAGRSIVIWTVDMTSVGTGIGYLFTCLAARKVILATPEIGGKAMKLFCCAIGTLTALLCILLLLVPGSPAQIATPPMICLAIWVFLGIVFYYTNRQHWISLPEEEIKTHILGNPDIRVFYK